MSPAHAEGAAPGMEKVQEFLNSPQGVLIVSGIATVYSGTLYKGAAKQEEESEANVKKIDKIIASFKDSYSGYCPNGRESLSEPQCYCYTSDGKQNSTRVNSQICKDLWAKDSFKLSGAANNYEINPYNLDVSGCVTVTGQFDETCKCKKLVDASGKNACKKESSIAISTELATAGFATSTGLKDLLQFSANATNGNPRLDTIDTASLANKAINAKKFGEQMISKIDTSKFGNPTLINEDNVGKFAKAILGEKNMADAMKSSSGMASNVSSARSDNPEFGNLLKEAQAKAGIELSGGKGINSAKAEKKKGLNLNFGSDGAPTGQVVQDFGAAEDKNYKYKNNDIVKDNSASIFEIISNRYVQSGLRRLFDDEEQKN